MKNQLWFGDNLTILREEIADESVDLVYLDPPFKSQVNYNVLFRTSDEDAASAQVEAFRDTWTWGPEAKWAFDEIMHTGGGVTPIVHALHAALGDSDMMAYLVMMAQRLHELRRVLRPTGSLYLHCDPTASHYLKIILDAIFGPTNFLNEVIWKRTSAHSSARRYGPIHDVLLFYSRGERHCWNAQYQPYDAEYLDTFFDQEDADGRRWKRTDLTGAGKRNGETGKPWRGIDITAKGRHWSTSPDQLDALDLAGKVHWPRRRGGMPRLRQYPKDLPGVALQDIWMDIKPLHNRAAERLHYPTQKPVSLLDRILQCGRGGAGSILRLRNDHCCCPVGRSSMDRY